MACDGRVVDADSSTILSDGERKYALCGTTTVLVAGTVGKLWNRLQAQPPRSYKALRGVLDEHPEDDTEWLAYDRKADRLFMGEVTIPRPIAAIGCGAPFALGALEALPLAKTLEAAYHAVATAIAIACRRNACCGGRIRILTIPRKGPIKIGAPTPVAQS